MFKQPNEINLDADLPELTAGGVRADPPKGKAAPRVPALAEEMASPAPAVAPTAVYTPPPKGASHPKVSRKAAAERLDKAEANLTACNFEVSAAYHGLRAAEREEAAAHQVLISAMPGPSAEAVHRAMIQQDTDRKLQRLAEGKAAVEPNVETARSPIDRAAAQRPRTSAQGANTPLFSPTPRFTV